MFMLVSVKWICLDQLTCGFLFGSQKNFLSNDVKDEYPMTVYDVNAQNFKSHFITPKGL